MNTDPNSSALSRRCAIAGIAVAVGSLAAGSLARAQAQQMTPQEPAMAEKPSTSANQARTSIHYEIEFKASPQRLYEAIMNQTLFAALTSFPTKIDPTPGGAFSMFGGQIVGRNVELIPNQRIVQAWRPTHWEAGVYSIVHFEFKPRGPETTLVFDHTGFPAGEYDHLDWGWQNHYWEPLKKFLV